MLIGGTKSLSASERLKLKKSGKPIPTVTVGDANAVTKLTELANTVLSRTGNMDIYQQTFKDISKLVRFIQIERIDFFLAMSTLKHY